MKTIAYIRVSTDEQAKSGLGLQAQRDSITEYAARCGLEVSEWFLDDEAISGTKLEERVGLMNALASLKKRDVLLVAKRDRLSRGNQFHAAWIDKEATVKGARIISAAGEGTAGDDPVDVLLRRVIDAFAEFEVAMIRFRTRAALQVKIRRGERVGRIATFGYSLDKDGRHVRNETEKFIIDEILAMRAIGYTAGKVSRTLSENGYLSRNGGPISRSTILTVERRERANALYKGQKEKEAGSEAAPA